MMKEKFLQLGEYAAAGMYEEPHRSLFYRKALGIRRFYENCELPQYCGKKLYPHGWQHTEMRVRPHYFYGLDFYNYNFYEKSPELCHNLFEEFGKYYSCLPEEHTIAGNMYTHSMPNYPRILAEGIKGYIKRIEKLEEGDFRDGLLHVTEGIKTFANRCADYLQSQNADGKLISALRNVPMNPARDIYEAVVCWNFVMYLDNCDNLGCVADGLLPYYKGEDIVPLLSELYDNIDANSGYSMAIHADNNPLTVQCLEAAKGKRRPMIELFTDENTSDEIWEKAFELIRTSGGQPAFYNPALLKGLQEKFPNLSDGDIKKFCGCGCTESCIEGMSAIGSIDAGIHLLLCFEQTMKAHLTTAESFEDFYEKYINHVASVVDDITEKISISQLNRKEYNPVPMRTLLTDDCIDNATEYNSGGARYKWSLINFSGIINVIDGMQVIKGMIFEDKSITPEKMLKKLEDNDEEFLKLCRNHKDSFGNDNAAVNDFANRISDDILSMLDGKKPAIGDAFLPCFIQFNNVAYAGTFVDATPDGREAKTPVCDSLGAIFGKDTKGPTALLKSVTSLRLDKALGVPVLNFNIDPDFKGENLKSLIMGYFALGGLQMQITCISSETLQKAYENPELYKNLVVRVGGYSEYFYYLSDEMKRVIINRTIQKGL